MLLQVTCWRAATVAADWQLAVIVELQRTSIADQQRWFFIHPKSTFQVVIPSCVWHWLWPFRFRWSDGGRRTAESSPWGGRYVSSSSRGCRAAAAAAAATLATDLFWNRNSSNSRLNLRGGPEIWRPTKTDHTWCSSPPSQLSTQHWFLKTSNLFSV